MTIQKGPKKENMETGVIDDLVGGDVVVENEVLEESDVDSSEEKAKLFHKKILMQRGCI